MPLMKSEKKIVPKKWPAIIFMDCTVQIEDSMCRDQAGEDTIDTMNVCVRWGLD